MLLLLAIIIAATASFLLALVSDAYADGLSRVVEATFDFIEYRAALRARRRASLSSADGVAYRGALHARTLS